VRSWRLIVLLGLALLVPAPAHGQRTRDARTAVTHPVVIAERDSTDHEPRHIGRRTLIGFLGLAGGAVVGYLMGSSFGSDCGDCWFGPPEAFGGALIGAVVGAAAGASLPTFESTCPRGTRLVRGTIGATVGLLAGAVGAELPLGAIGLLIFPPLGAALAQGRCA
jgi:hypothetical protein